MQNFFDVMKALNRVNTLPKKFDNLGKKKSGKPGFWEILKKNLERPGILNKNLKKSWKNLEFLTIFTYIVVKF